MTREELAQFDGREGRKAYVAVSGKVYDLTGSERWEKGLHEGQHRAGTDLTQDLLRAPHVRAVVERFPIVARLEETSQPQKKSSAPLLWTALVLGAIIFLAFMLL